MPYKDIKKRREYRRKWYHNNKSKERQHIKRRKKEIRKWFIEYKSNLHCNKCGERDMVCIDFHHKIGTKKEKSVSVMVSDGYSIQRILNEIKKCEPLCSNCHKKEHNLKW